MYIYIHKSERERRRERGTVCGRQVGSREEPAENKKPWNTLYIHIHVYIYKVNQKAEERDEGSEELFVAGKLEVEKDLQKTKKHGPLYIYTFRLCIFICTRGYVWDRKRARNCLWPASWKSSRTYTKNMTTHHTYIYIYMYVYLYVYIYTYI